MSIFSNPLVWPSLSEELAPYLKYCRGIVLNAGSGQRGIQLGQKDLRIDIDLSNEPDIIADLHSIPLLDQSVDTVVSIAVLEHTRYPWLVAQEFCRVLRPGGYGVIAIPFLQPQHACPNDFTRFTENGLIELMNYAGFEVVETGHVHHFGQTLAWLLWEYIQFNKPSKFTQPLWMILINQLSKGTLFKGDSPNTHNTHYVVVRKPGEFPAPSNSSSQIVTSEDSKTWFFPLLACPQSKQPLSFTGEQFVSEDAQLTYTFKEGIPDLRPNQELKISNPVTPTPMMS